jgi:GntR family transcriptional regulator
MSIKHLNADSATPLHKQAEELLRELAAGDEYSRGKLFPNEVDLAKQLQISRSTLRLAINKLVYEGLLVRKKGFGTVVAPMSVMSNGRNWGSFTQEMKAQGIQVENFELHTSRKVPPAEVAKFLKSKPDERLFCMERLRGRPGLPFVYFISYFNPAIGISVNENFSRPLYELLQTDYGIVVKTSREMISARTAGAFIAEKLNIPEDSPVLVRKRFVLDAADKPVEYNIGFYRSDSFVYTLEISK